MVYRRSPDHTPVSGSRAEVSGQASIPVQVYRHVGRPAVLAEKLRRLAGADGARIGRHGTRLSGPSPPASPPELLGQARQAVDAVDRSLSSWIRLAVEHELRRDVRPAKR